MSIYKVSGTVSVNVSLQLSEYYEGSVSFKDKFPKNILDMDMDEEELTFETPMKRLGDEDCGTVEFSLDVRASNEEEAENIADSFLSNETNWYPEIERDGRYAFEANINSVDVEISSVKLISEEEDETDETELREALELHKKVLQNEKRRIR